MHITWYVQGHIFNKYLRSANYVLCAAFQKSWLFLWFSVNMPYTMLLKHNPTIVKKGNEKGHRYREVCAVEESRGSLKCLHLHVSTFWEIGIERAKVIETEQTLKLTLWKTISVEREVLAICDTNHLDVSKPRWIWDLFQYGI